VRGKSEKAAVAAAKKEQLEKEERDKKAREEKAEKEARERLAAIQQQQRAPAPKRTPTSPRNAAASGSSQRSSPSTNGAPKKILNKPPPVSPAPLTTTQAQRQPQQRPVINTISQPQTPISPPVASHLPPPSASMYGQGPGMIPTQAISPRGQPTTPYSFGPGPSLQQGPPSGLAPSALPPNFGLGSAFEPGFGRGLAPAAPIGPPPKGIQNPLGTSQPLAPGPSRRTSVLDPGPVARPIAPIARPSGDGTSSPSRRSPSPKGVLGSSALTADDDEVVPLPGRRVAPGAVGQGWGGPASPRTAIGESARAPWGAPTSGPAGFVSPRPPSVGNLWGNTAPNADWHPSSGNFYTSPFATHDPSPPPHTG
jgi:hypothetical protein